MAQTIEQTGLDKTGAGEGGASNAVVVVQLEVREVDIQRETSAVALLAAASGLSKANIKKAMTRGAVWRRSRGAAVEMAAERQTGRARRLRRATAKLAPGDQLSLYYNPRILSETSPQALLLDDHGAYSIWDKPPGMLCQGSKWGDHCTLIRWAEQQLAPRKAFTVHRLDRMASGLVVLAHDKAAARHLSAQFAARKVSKWYRCTVYGQVLLEEPRLLDAALDGKQARTWIERAQPLVGAVFPGSELLVRIETGRKHQIRKHLAMAGMPIVGDRLYAGTRAAEAADLQLRAIRLALQDPDTGLLCEWNIQ